MCKNGSFVVKQTKDRGFGIYANKTFVAGASKSLKHVAISGLLWEVSGEEFWELENLGYNSLFSNDKKGKYKKNYILFGPLSILNHCCNSNFRFQIATKKKSLKLFDGKNYLQPELTLVNIGKQKRILQGEEITCKFAPVKDLWFACNCGSESCVTVKKNKRAKV